MNILSALGVKQKSRIDRFNELIQGKTREEVRAIEMQFLKPEPMLPYDGPSPKNHGVSDTKVILYIPPKRYWRIFKKIFRVSCMGEKNENSVRDIRIILALLDEMITGRIVYDAETNKLILVEQYALERENARLRIRIEQLLQSLTSANIPDPDDIPF